MTLNLPHWTSSPDGEDWKRDAVQEPASARPPPTRGQNMSEKLTEAQNRFLAELRDNTRFGARNANLGNRTAEALRREKLVEWKPGRWFGGRYEITPAGRAALKGD